MQKKILLKNAWLINKEGKPSPGERNIAIAYGMIQRVSAAEIPEKGFDQVVDCTGYYVTPGLTNLHCHCAMNLFKGLAEDADSDTWFNKIIFPYESQLEAEDVYVGTKLGIAEMLNCGVTAFADHYFEEEAVLRAVLEMGIRADLAPTVFGTAPDFERRLDEVSDFCEKNRDISERVTFRLGPHAPYTCPPPTLEKVVERAKELELGLHIHVAETEKQVEESLAAYGKTPFGLLKESGAFDLPMIVAHGLWATEKDMEFLKWREEPRFAFCPKTYEKLSMGTGLAFARRKELWYSFGTDGAASSNTLNPLEQARYFALLGKFAENDATAYEVHEVWKALMRGHSAFDFNSGVINAECAADLVIWDLNKPNTWPYFDPVVSILYSSEPSNVLYTMVDGVFLKENGKLTMDEAALLKEGKEARRRVMSRGKGRAKVVY